MLLMISMGLALQLAVVAQATLVPAYDRWEQPLVAVGIALSGTFLQDNDITDKSAEAIMAQHGYTFTFGGNETECAKHNLGGLKLPSQIPANASAPQHPPSIWGYNVGDEPGTAQFAAFGQEFAAIRQRAPGKMGFGNLLETYCPSLSLSANPAGPPGSPVNWTLSYEDYVDQYLDQASPSFLCMDYYPYFEPQQAFAHFNRMPATTRGRGKQTMANYLGNVAILRRAGLKRGLRWWNYFGAADFQGHTAVTEKHMELQMFASLTAGSTGLLYWVGGDGDMHAGWAYPHGRHWAQARRLNRKVAALSPTLMNLTSQELLHVRAADAPDLTTHTDRNESRVSLALTSIAETVGCSGQSIGGGSPTSDTAEVFGCYAGYEYLTCPNMRPADDASVAQNPCTLDGSECAVPVSGGWGQSEESFCIDDYPADQCKALCEALGGAGGASNYAGAELLGPDYSCAAYVTSAVSRSRPAPPKNERCCIYTSAFTTNQTTLVVDGLATLHLQVSNNRSVEHWECPAQHSFPAHLPSTTARKRLSVGGEFIVGQFQHSDGRQAVMVQNFDHTLSAMPTLFFPNATANSTAEPGKAVLYEVVQRRTTDGREVPVTDELPTVPGLQISLDASEARLFLLGPAR